MIRNNIVSPLPANMVGISEEVIGLGLVFKATALDALFDLALRQTWEGIHSK
jgi:hypothetical protein